MDEGLSFDVLVEELIICKLKAVDEMNPVRNAQILSHFRLTGKRLGFLINFNVPLNLIRLSGSGFNVLG